MRVSRTVKKGGVLKYDGWRWQSDDLIALFGRWVWIEEVADSAATKAIRVEDKDGAHLADAARGDKIT